MKKNKYLKYIILLVVILIGSLVTFFVLTKEDKVTTLNLMEKKWIEDNKNKRLDFYVTTNIPVFSYEGNGLFLDFLKDLEDITGLEFNLNSMPSTEVKDYSFSIVDEIKENDLLVYEDKYALVSKTDIKYNNLSDINNIIVGTINSEINDVNYYLKGLSVTYKTYEDVTKLFEGLKNSEVNAIVIPQMLNFDKINENKLFVNYTISELSKKIVLRLGKTNRLNDILTKYYEKWSKEEFAETFNSYLADIFYNANAIDEVTKSKSLGKIYKYGYIMNAPYDDEKSSLNKLLIEDYMEFSGMTVEFKKYDNVNDLVKAFNKNEIDFMFEMQENKEFDIDAFSTVSTFDEKQVVLASVKNDVIVNSLNSLNGYTVLVNNASFLGSYLEADGLKIKKYNSLKDLSNGFKENNLIAMDNYTYLYYQDSYFKDMLVKYDFYTDNDYLFVMRDINNNEVFNKSFDFYLRFMNAKENFYQNYYRVIDSNRKKSGDYTWVFILGTSIAVILIVLWLYKNVKVKLIKQPLSKEDKIKYIDMLTSLKNRNYLNDNVNKWDESEVYPQTIIIADLNNVAYINDNYGHGEGDNLIKEAANILIKTQIINSEIIRTNGNEFLIYLVGYDEKQIIAYTKKLTREFKELAHGFGVALGYSMITDAIKTVDDAINEATLDMRNNKEEASNE